MSIVNCTPDSFYPASRARSPEAAAAEALAAASAGADLIDFGAESSRPGGVYIPAEEELARLIPALRAFRKVSSLPVSVDTRKAVVARAALEAGADIINDISALADDPEMAGLCAAGGAAVVLMHGAAGKSPVEREAARTAENGDGTGTGGGVGEVRRFLEAAVERALEAGICRERIILDPGIGFGKTTEENCSLLCRLAEIRFGDYPVLVGASRKRFIGGITGKDISARLAGSLAAASAALWAGADILRVHDTAETVDLVRVITAVRGALGKAEGIE